MFELNEFGYFGIGLFIITVIATSIYAAAKISVDRDKIVKRVLLGNLVKINVIALFIMLLTLTLNYYNYSNRSTTKAVLESESIERVKSSREERVVSEPLVEVEDRDLQNQLRELERLCSRERSETIFYESNYCEKLELLKERIESEQ